MNVKDIDERDETVRYVQNESGTIHAVTQWHYDNYVAQTSPSGRRYPPAGWRDLSEAEARELRPQIFGAPDPNVQYTMEELKHRRDQLAFEQELRAEAEKVSKGAKSTKE